MLLSEEEKRRQLKIKINIAYFIAKEEEPFVKFGPLIRLHHKNGVDINPTYDNDVRCAEMIGQIADIMRESLSAKLKAVKYLAILIDGDTDISKCNRMQDCLCALVGGWEASQSPGWTTDP